MKFSEIANTNILPSGSRIFWCVLSAACIFMLGALWGQHWIAGAEDSAADKRTAKAVEVAQARERVVVKTEVQYRDRIRTVYVKGETIEKQVPIYVTAADDGHCSINAGFVRSYDAAWAGEPAGPAADSDREPAGIPLSVVAETDAHNATACLAWREQALGLRAFYARLQAASSGKTEGTAP